MAKSISDRMSFLVKFGLLPAEAYDFVFPHGIKFSAATKEYAMAGVVRDIGKKLTDKVLQKKLYTAGRAMVGFASKGLVVGWEEGDDICPPFGPPIPGPRFGPDPLPWHIEREEGIEEFANALKVIAGLSAVPAVAKELTDVAVTLAKQSIPG